MALFAYHFSWTPPTVGRLKWRDFIVYKAVVDSLPVSFDFTTGER